MNQNRSSLGIGNFLRNGIRPHGLTPPLFLATKLEAYGGRGQNDPLGSHDLEDIINVVDGRPALLSEVQAAQGEVRGYLSEQFQALLQHSDFENFLYGNIRGPDGRVAIVNARVKALAELGSWPPQNPSYKAQESST